MNIVKSGCVPSPRLLFGKCSHCGCVFNCREDEAVYGAYNYAPNEWSVTCPTPGCKQVVAVKYMENQSLEFLTEYTMQKRSPGSS